MMYRNNDLKREREFFGMIVNTINNLGRDDNRRGGFNENQYCEKRSV